MNQRTPNPYLKACPSRRIVDLVGDKWALLVLRALRLGSVRNGALLRRIEGISQKMLTQTLRDLERNGLVAREVHSAVPPHVDYQLTPLGRSLGDALAGFDVWLIDHTGDVEEARRSFEATERGGVSRTRLVC